MRHGTLTFVTLIRPGHELELRERLAYVQRDPAALFGALPGLHYARWALLNPEAPEGQRHLLLGVDVTLEDAGSRGLEERFLAELLQGSPSRLLAFHAIYRHCEGYEAEEPRPEVLTAYLLKHALRYAARHVEFPYRVEDAEGIRRLIALRGEVEAGVSQRATKPELLHGWLRAANPSSGQYLAGTSWRQRLTAARRDAALATLLYAPLGALLSRVFRVRATLTKLRHKVHGRASERRDSCPAPSLAEFAADDRRQALIEQESGSGVQNPLTLVTRVPTLRAWLRMKFILKLVDLRFQRYLVGLNDIRRIHCARWVTHTVPASGPGRRRERYLVFLTNYDDSLQAYLDAFVDHTDVFDFLKLIWSPMEGFPQEHPGEAFVGPFRKWIRGIHVPTLVWYSAYRHGREPMNLSVMDIHRSLRLRSLLAQEQLDPEQACHFRELLSTGVCPIEDKLMNFKTVALHLREWVADALDSGRSERRNHETAFQDTRLEAGRAAASAAGALSPPGHAEPGVLRRVG